MTDQITIRNRYMDLLCELVSIDSSNPPGKEWEVMQAIARFFGFRMSLDAHGRCSLTAYQDCRAAIEGGCLEIAPMRGNLYFILRGKERGQALAFTGHMDTVPVGQEERYFWKTDPFRPAEKDGYLYGRGTTDMKGGLTAAMIAFKLKAEQIADSAELPDHDIYLLITCDEEANMQGSARFLQEPWIKEISRLVVCEPTGLELCVEGRGRTYGKIVLRGQTGHGSLHRTGNVIHTAANLIKAMEKEDFSVYCDEEFGSSFWQCLAIHAEKDPCVVPDDLEMIIDARLAANHRCEDIWDRMDAILKTEIPERSGIRYQVQITDRRYGWKTPPESAFRQSMADTLTRINIPVKEVIFSGTTDASKLRTAGMETLIIGPGDLKLAHKENEAVSIHEGLKAVELYRELMERN